ncbi:hypothetical protein mRhiFer1_009474 [Rhinolophus ferrumequinum]|uniref:Uncharacterized protein n=1 Tax=Rhinolophus ferrumequinum TaxID=59479 RepID=A0A7J7RF36_RHIFE|nr:hypothetical protein mRhiFer1_009474 [Rhinolophus ferrumequinum]
MHVSAPQGAVILISQRRSLRLRTPASQHLCLWRACAGHYLCHLPGRRRPRLCVFSGLATCCVGRTLGCFIVDPISWAHTGLCAVSQTTWKGLSVLAFCSGRLHTCQVAESCSRTCQQSILLMDCRWVGDGNPVCWDVCGGWGPGGLNSGKEAQVESSALSW